MSKTEKRVALWLFHFKQNCFSVSMFFFYSLLKGFFSFQCSVMTSEYYDVCFVTMVLAKEERRWSGSSGATARRSCSSSTLLMASSNYTESCSSLRTCTCDLELDRWATNNVNFYKEKSSSNSLIYKTGFVYVFVFDSVFPLNRLSIASKSRRKTAENSVQFWREK